MRMKIKINKYIISLIKIKLQYIKLKKENYSFPNFLIKLNIYTFNGDWGLGIGDWGLGIAPNPQSPIPNPQSPIPNPQYSLTN